MTSEELVKKIEDLESRIVVIEKREKIRRIFKIISIVVTLVLMIALIIVIFNFINYYKQTISSIFDGIDIFK